MRCVSGAPVLALTDLSIGFGEREILRQVKLRIAGPGCVVLLGPSGTGKSTLLRTLAGFNDANPSLRMAGLAEYCGQPLPSAGHRPPLVMQKTRLLISTALENLVSEWPLRASLSQSKQLETLSRWLEDMGEGELIPLLRTPVVQLPLGFQRRLAILGQALLNPALLMVDEPTQGLDRSDSDRVLALLRKVSRQRCVLVTLHNLIEARHIADEVVLLAARKVQEHGPASSFFNQPQTGLGQQFLRSGSCPDLEPEASAETSDGGSEAAMPPEPDADSPPPMEQVTADTAPADPSTDGRSPPASSRGPRGFTWLLPGALAGTPWPGLLFGADYDLGLLRSVGVTRLVSLTETPFDATQAGHFGMRCSALPIEDMHPPSLQQAVDLCRNLDQWIAEGECIAVHCKAGLGRTGTVLGAYWLWIGQGQISAVQALQQIRRLEPGWVQSESQIEFLEVFAHYIQRGLVSTH